MHITIGSWKALRMFVLCGSLVCTGCSTKEEVQSAANKQKAPPFERLRLGSSRNLVYQQLSSLGFKNDPHNFGWEDGSYFSTFNFVGPLFEDPDRLVEYSARLDATDSATSAQQIASVWEALTQQDGKHDSTLHVQFTSGSGTYRYWSRDSFMTVAGFNITHDSATECHLSIHEWIEGKRDIPLVPMRENPNVVRYRRLD